jgi:hypothetical protein
MVSVEKANIVNESVPENQQRVYSGNQQLLRRSHIGQ